MRLLKKLCRSFSVTCHSVSGRNPWSREVRTGKTRWAQLFLPSYSWCFNTCVGLYQPFETHNKKVEGEMFGSRIVSRKEKRSDYSNSLRNPKSLSCSLGCPPKSYFSSSFLSSEARGLVSKGPSPEGLAVCCWCAMSLAFIKSPYGWCGWGASRSTQGLGEVTSCPMLMGPGISE